MCKKGSDIHAAVRSVLLAQALSMPMSRRRGKGGIGGDPQPITLPVFALLMRGGPVRPIESTGGQNSPPRPEPANGSAAPSSPA